MEIPETRYAKATDGTNLAYQVYGEGDVDLLYISGWVSHLEVFWELPAFARFMRRLGLSFRVITFDKRGTGMSDRVTRFPDLETMMDDVRSVLDAAGSERTVLLGVSTAGGGSAAVSAASFPERVIAFVWWGPQARSKWTPDYPWGSSEDEDAGYTAFLEDTWGDESRGAEILRQVGILSLADDPEAQRWVAKLCRYAATPDGALAFDRMWDSTDVRAVLPAIRVPTLLMRREWKGNPAEEELRYIGARIPVARLMTLGGEDFPPWSGDQGEAIEAIEAFIRDVRQEEAEFDRVLATVLFTDIVDSTSSAAGMGDVKWRALVADHDRLAKGVVARYRGEFVRGTGDGMLATFDGPARAVRCAQALVDAVKPLGLEIRAGAHTGEITYGGNDLAGIGVHIAARVAAMAAPSEVWASSTVKDLTAGSGLTFEDAGEHELKGVPDSWHLYRVLDPP